MSVTIAIKKAGETLVVEGYSDVCVNGPGVRVEVHRDGSVDVFGSAPVILHQATHGNSATAGGTTVQVGDVMPDGTIYAGRSPDTNRPMYAAPSDAPLSMKWKKAMQYASAISAGGPYKDWRLPTKAELNVLFNSRTAIGGFDETGSIFSGWYWSATETRGHPDDAWMERFRDGLRHCNWKDIAVSVRLVRSGP